MIYKRSWISSWTEVQDNSTLPNSWFRTKKTYQTPQNHHHHQLRLKSWHGMYCHLNKILQQCFFWLLMKKEPIKGLGIRNLYESDTRQPGNNYERAPFYLRSVLSGLLKPSLERSVLMFLKKTISLLLTYISIYTHLCIVYCINIYLHSLYSG